MILRRKVNGQQTEVVFGIAVLDRKSRLDGIEVWSAKASTMNVMVNYNTQDHDKFWTKMPSTLQIIISAVMWALFSLNDKFTKTIKKYKSNDHEIVAMPTHA
jgi:hypothetical protein